MMKSSFTLILILIVLITNYSNLLFAQQSSLQTNDKDHKFIVFHKFPQQTSYTKRGEVVIVTKKGISQYIGLENNVFLHDDNHDERNNNENPSPLLYFIKLVDVDNQNNVLKSFTKMVKII